MSHCITNVIFIIVVNIVYSSTQESNFVALQNYRHFWRYKRQAECGNLEFKCNSGQCFPLDIECDGQTDCDDGSDESNCSSFRCTENLFQCAYGACIREDFMCDGKPDCKDLSDEPSSCVELRKTPILKPKTGFRCEFGVYIDENFVCDGKADCIDGSDETSIECQSIACSPTLFFRCDYGACVDKEAKCNNVEDCVDGSDEKDCFHKISLIPKGKAPTEQILISSSSVNGSCLLPINPPNTVYTTVPSLFKPGNYVPEKTPILITCKRGHKVDPATKQEVSICIGGNWIPTLSVCKRTCPPVFSTTATSIKCAHNDILLKSCEDPVDGTVAHLKCQPYYEDTTVSMNPIRYCEDGSWDFPISECQPSCGQKRPPPTVLIAGGQTANINEYPWHVGIYLVDNSYICGGSIINLKVVLSAAHCFSNIQGNLLNIKNYKIAAGKYYRTYDDSRDSNAQYSKIEKVYVPNNYKGIENDFNGNVAVIILETPFQISRNVQPVCLDTANKFEHSQLKAASIGVVVSWKPSEFAIDQLQKTQINLKSYTDCQESISAPFEKYLTYEKICVDINEDDFECPGNYGDGLTMQWNQNRYYIIGIATISPHSTVNGKVICKPEKYGAYTLIAKHIDFITRFENLHRV